MIILSHCTGVFFTNLAAVDRLSPERRFLQKRRLFEKVVAVVQDEHLSPGRRLGPLVRHHHLAPQDLEDEIMRRNFRSRRISYGTKKCLSLLPVIPILVIVIWARIMTRGKLWIQIRVATMMCALVVLGTPKRIACNCN